MILQINRKRLFALTYKGKKWQLNKTFDCEILNRSNAVLKDYYDYDVLITDRRTQIQHVRTFLWVKHNELNYLLNRFYDYGDTI